MSEEWQIPPKLQPDPSDFGFDLDRALSAVVGLRSHVPADAFTAGALGTERSGSGVVINKDGLILTIGYLITEAETIWLTSADGRAVQGHALGFDQESGLGLVQPLGRLGLPHLEPGEAQGPSLGDRAILASGGGRKHSIETKVVARQEFAGYWEYLLDEAIFTAPAHPFWGGAALISAEGRVLGVGSLILQQGDGKGRRHDMNMIVPVGLLKPAMNDLLSYGRVTRSPRPWLGIYAIEGEDGVAIEGLADGGPAERAGLRAGDRILEVGGDEIADLAGLWRRIWSIGPAGVAVPMRIAREEGVAAVSVSSADRSTFLRAPRFH